MPAWDEVPFFAGQVKVVLRDCGLINPDDVEEYIAVGGYQALYKVLIDRDPAGVVEQIKLARLRGRGGAGYLTGNKWEFLRTAAGPDKVIICNADEGDPGAYMNRNEIESDPHALLEGMAIAGFVTGAPRGIIYVRAEYPIAIIRLERAIAAARERGLLGRDILGRGFDFDIEIVEGAGAFVCGEETALIASLEDRAGRPRPRPPFPSERGLRGRPTNINNVETWYNVAPIVTKGAAWFTDIGSPKSAGTKVFSLVGKVRSTGLVEMPLGTPLARFLYDVGGGGLHGREIKAVQTGGPSGGCIPAEMFDTPVDYETLAQLGSIMGSGGMVVLDEDNCMVDVARYFIEFTRSESCGKCVPCRVGLHKALRILDRFTHGNATHADLSALDELCRMVRDTSLCALGQSAPNPVLTSLRHFRHEFEDHIMARRCRAGVCEDLALSPCENSCPLHMNIPRFLELYKEDRLEDAFLSVILDNPLPASTGRVCQHPCDDRCRRAAIDEAVNMREVHRAIADQVLLTDRFEGMVPRVLERRMPPTGQHVAVVGAGPTGLTCAYYLALLGHAVTVYESRPAAGGMLRYALPEYRLPKAVLDREIELIARLGVDFRFNVNVGDDLGLNEIAQQYDAVFLSIGTWKESWVYLPGTELTGVIPALPFLEAVSRDQPVPVGRSIVVIGGGNAAIDSARTARRLGAQVTVVYRRQRADMPAIAEEVEAAEHEGVHMVYLAAPHRILGDREGRVVALEAVRTRPGPFDTSGRRRPMPTDEIVRFECDSVVLAVGESVDPRLLRGLRPEGQGDQDPRGRPLLPGDQPRPLLRWRRPHHRRLQRLQCHGPGQEGRPDHPSPPDRSRGCCRPRAGLRVRHGGAGNAQPERAACLGGAAGCGSRAIQRGGDPGPGRPRRTRGDIPLPALRSAQRRPLGGCGERQGEGPHRRAGHRGPARADDPASGSRERHLHPVALLPRRPQPDRLLPALHGRGGRLLTPVAGLHDARGGGPGREHDLCAAGGLSQDRPGAPVRGAQSRLRRVRLVGALRAADPGLRTRHPVGALPV